jgi:UDP-glucose:(heptosyl)LPS alpha-1,3-glucosyltransferase
MRIAHIYPFVHLRGGVERYIVELIRNQSSEHQITMVANEVDWTVLPKKPSLQFLKISCLKLPSFLTSISFCIMALIRVQRSDFDVLHAQGASFFKPDIVTAQSVHLAWFRSSLASLKRFSKAWWLKVLNPMHHLTIAIERIQYRRGGARHIIAISNIVRQELIRFHHIDPERISVIYSGVNLEMFHPSLKNESRTVRKSEFGFEEADIVLIFVANEFRRKGLRTILDAMASLAETRLHLLVVGGDSADSFHTQINQLSLEKYVRFLGRSGRIPQLMSMSDIFVFPTAYEPFGLVITEAMACGLPVLTSRIAGAAELIQDGFDGLLLDDPNDAKELAAKLRKLLNEDMRKTIGIRARAKAELFSFKSCSTATCEAYQKLLTD